MSGKGKGGRGKGKGKAAGTSKSAKAGLQFPVARIGRYIKKGGYSSRVGSVGGWGLETEGGGAVGEGSGV